MPESKRVPVRTGGGLADLHPEPGPGRGLCAVTDDDDGPFTQPPEDDSSVISLPPLATFTGSGTSPVAWESEPRSSSGRRERSGLLSEAADDGLRVSSECGSPVGSRRGGTPPPPPEPPVSRAQVAVIGLACFCTFGMGGVVFGISSLYPVLYAQGYWRAICDEAAASLCTGHSTKCCEAQLVRYSLVASRADTQRHGVPQPYRTHRLRVPASCVPEGQGSLPRQEPPLCVRTSLGRAVPYGAPCVVCATVCLYGCDSPRTVRRTAGRVGLTLTLTLTLTRSRRRPSSASTSPPHPGASWPTAPARVPASLRRWASAR